VLTAPGAEPVDGVVVFTDDHNFTTISGWRDETTDLYVNTAAVGGDVTWNVDWAPGAAAYALPEFRLAFDVPAGVEVRCWVGGAELPVRRGYASPRDEPQPVGPIDPELELPLVDLSALRTNYPDPDRPWPIRVTLQNLPSAPFRGVHIVGAPRRRTDQCTILPAQESAWLSGVIDSVTTARMSEGWTLAGLVVANQYRGDPPGARYESGVVYGHTPEGPLKAMVCRRADPAERAPAIVFVHGGGWVSGDPGFHYRHMWWLAQHGYVTMSVAYRKHPHARWRDSVADIKCAVRWVRAHAAELGADPDRIAICGGSAGGQLAGLVATTPGEFDGAGDWLEQSSAVSAAMLFYPPVDMVKLRAFAGPHVVTVVDQYFGSEFALASPANHLGPDTPPILTMTGGADRVVPVGPIQEFHAELDRLGVPNRLVVYPGRDHAFELFTPEWDDTATELLRFAQEHLGRPAAVGRPVDQIAP
jgi:acetyl esterase/lipase